MKSVILAVLCGCWMGCEYTTPLSKSPELEIDRSVLGLWERSNDQGEKEQLLVLPLDRNEYLVSFPAGAKEAMFARAWLCSAAHKPLVQLKWLGTAQAELPGDQRVFQFLTYAVNGDRITVRLLNSDVVKRDTTSPDELARGITANKDNPKLFREGMIFSKIKK